MERVSRYLAMAVVAVALVSPARADELSEFTYWSDAHPTLPGESALRRATFPIGCVDVRTGTPRDCQFMYQSYFRLPDDIGQQEVFWAGGHLHGLEDPARPIGTLCQKESDSDESCPPEDLDADTPRGFQMQSLSRVWTGVKTVPPVSGVITVFAWFRTPPTYYCVDNDQWRCDPYDQTGRIGYMKWALRVRVPDLIELPSSPSTYWRCGDTATCSSGDNEDVHHPRAFFGTPDMIEAVQQLAVRFQDEYPSLRLRFTDMSLPWGGLFDYTENWDVPHSARQHHAGAAVDVSRSAVDVDGRMVTIVFTNVEDDLDSIAEKELNLMRREKFAADDPEGRERKIHYELPYSR